jgi:membrane fusion protein, copper/silver efflux system
MQFNRTLWTRVLLVAAPLLAIVAAWLATRPDPESSAVVTAKAPDAAHDHAGMNMGGDTASRVSLDAGTLRRIGVTFAPVTSGPLESEVRATGQVLVDEARVHTISLKVDGWVEQLFVNTTGAAVSRGAPLLSLYSPMLLSAQEELLLASKLTREVAAGSNETRDGARELASAARRRLQLWDITAEQIARIERAGSPQRALVMYAPAGGVVLDKFVTQGQRVMAGDPLFRVADLSTVWVEGDIYEQDLRSVRTGQRVTAHFEALPGQELSGRVSFIYPTLSPETRTARVRVSIANPGLRLKPGMFATLEIESESRGVTLSVPRGALLSTGERQIVFVLRNDGQLEPRQVSVGATSDTRIEILSGLVQGDTVVASATFLIDAESNLGTALGGMGNMPGMEITTPPVAPSKPTQSPVTQPRSTQPPRTPPRTAPPPSTGGARPPDTSGGF